MERIAKFFKVSEKRFLEDYLTHFPEEGEERAREIYASLILPRRATSGSAGYDFFIPKSLTLAPNETVMIPTGMSVRMSEGWVLFLYPRSGLGFKYRFQLNNTVGVIDSDYFYSDNEGHIFARMTNDSNEGKTLCLEAGTAFMQGVFVPYGITEDDTCAAVRNGGLGSTSL